MTKFNIHVNKAGKGFEVDFSTLPTHVQTHIIEYGLKQKFNDCHASETDGEKAFGLTQNLLERLMAGELTKARNAGSPVEREMHSLLIQVVRAKVGGKVVDLKAMELDELLSALAKGLGKDKARLEVHFRALAEKAIAKRAEEQSALLKDLDI